MPTTTPHGGRDESAPNTAIDDLLAAAFDPTTSDDELIRLTVSCPAAFGVFYARHVRAVLHYHYRRTHDADVAADLTSETFAAALHGASRFDFRRGTASQWLYGIASNQLSVFSRRRRVSDKLRRKLAVNVIEIDPMQAAEFERVEALVDAAPVADTLDRLPERLRHAVRLRVVDELSYDEIADRLGCSRGAARVRVSRGLRRLAEVLDA